MATKRYVCNKFFAMHYIILGTSFNYGYVLYKNILSRYKYMYDVVCIIYYMFNIK